MDENLVSDAGRKALEEVGKLRIIDLKEEEAIESNKYYNQLKVEFFNQQLAKEMQKSGSYPSRDEERRLKNLASAESSRRKKDLRINFYHNKLTQIENLALTLADEIPRMCQKAFPGKDQQATAPTLSALESTAPRTPEPSVRPSLESLTFNSPLTVGSNFRLEDELLLICSTAATPADVPLEKVPLEVMQLPGTLHEQLVSGPDSGEVKSFQELEKHNGRNTSSDSLTDYGEDFGDIEELW